MSGGGSQKMSVFVHAQGIKIVHTGGVEEWQNPVHVVVECPLICHKLDEQKRQYVPR